MRPEFVLAFPHSTQSPHPKVPTRSEHSKAMRTFEILNPALRRRVAQVSEISEDDAPSAKPRLLRNDINSVITALSCQYRSRRTWEIDFYETATCSGRGIGEHADIEKERLLKNHGDRAAQHRGAVPCRGLPEDGHDSFIGMAQQRGDMEQGRFSRPVRTDQR